MKIKNDLISVKIGKKQYDFHNLILDEYLKKFAYFQLSDNASNVWIDRKLSYCLLKFDTPFENLQENTELHNQDFDICFLFGSRYNQTITENKIITQYEYDTSGSWNIWDYSKNTIEGVYLSNYEGRKITAIGFNSWWAPDTNTQIKYPVCAVLDTSNYNLYIQKNQDLSITRKDIITTDALFYSNNSSKVPGPAHLAPDGVPQIIYQPSIYNDEGSFWHNYNDKGQGKLYSIGLSSYVDRIDKEFVVGQDIEAIPNEIELEIEGLENYYSNEKLIYPNSNLYPSANLYSVKSNYKYIIFKYKIWQLVHSGTYDNVVSTNTDTGYFYHQAIPIDKFGKLNMKIKYERG